MKSKRQDVNDRKKKKKKKHTQCIHKIYVVRYWAYIH